MRLCHGVKASGASKSHIHGWVSIGQGENQSTCGQLTDCVREMPSPLINEGKAISSLTAAAAVAGRTAAATTLGSLSPSFEPKARLSQQCAEVCQ